tara:strand:+ start:936 stop:1142 length:207 start_codon:yes stop_codon:yes gene_type:complete
MRRLAVMESIANVVVGYLINLGLVYGILHWMGYGIRMGENAGMSMVLAAVAFGRGYFIRRIFYGLHND